MDIDKKPNHHEFNCQNIETMEAQILYETQDTAW